MTTLANIKSAALQAPVDGFSTQRVTVETNAGSVCCVVAHDMAGKSGAKHTETHWHLNGRRIAAAKIAKLLA